jgi:hypothetical protein
MSQDACTYRVDPAPVFLFAYVAGSLLCSGLVVALAIFDPSFQRAGVPVILETIGYVLVFFGPPYAALCALALTHYFHYEITPVGVKGHSLFGGTLFVEWAKVAGVRPLRVGNLEFVRLVASPDKRTVWLPMFVRPGSRVVSETLAWGVPHPFTKSADAPIATQQS